RAPLAARSRISRATLDFARTRASYARWRHAEEQNRGARPRRPSSSNGRTRPPQLPQLVHLPIIAVPPIIIRRDHPLAPIGRCLDECSARLLVAAPARRRFRADREEEAT